MMADGGSSDGFNLIRPKIVSAVRTCLLREAAHGEMLENLMKLHFPANVDGSRSIRHFLLFAMKNLKGYQKFEH